MVDIAVYLRINGFCTKSNSPEKLNFTENLQFSIISKGKKECMENLKIVIGSDHGGYNYKNKIIDYLKNNNIDYIDVGTYSEEACDYPLIAKKAAEKIVSGEAEKGILICGTGIGMSIAANKFKGIRAAHCTDTFSTKASRAHNNSNILCIGERITGECIALDIVDVWLKTKFEGGRHQRRVDMIE